MSIAFRPAELADHKFIISTWSRAFKRSRAAGIIASEDWEAVMHRQAQRLLARPTMRAIIAFERDDPDFFYGWIAGETAGRVPVVHFTYVKEDYRRWKDLHIGRLLFAALGVDPRKYFVFTCWTPILLEFDPSPIPLAKHDPNFARYTNYEPEERPWKR